MTNDVESTGPQEIRAFLASEIKGGVGSGFTIATSPGDVCPFRWIRGGYQLSIPTVPRQRRTRVASAKCSIAAV